MTILEENATLNQMLQYVKEHIDFKDYDPASNTLRKIGEHMAKHLIYHAGLWEEACTDENGKHYSTPAFGRCIYLLNKNKVLDRLTYEEVFRPLQKFGNRGSHDVAKVEEYEVIYAYNKTRKYVNDVFLRQFPNAGHYGVLPTINSQRTNTIIPQAEPHEAAKTSSNRAVADPLQPKPHVHTKSGWKTVIKATPYHDGEEQIVCITCGKTLESRKIPKITLKNDATTAGVRKEKPPSINVREYPEDNSTYTQTKKPYKHDFSVPGILWNIAYGLLAIAMIKVFAVDLLGSDNSLSGRILSVVYEHSIITWGIIIALLLHIFQSVHYITGLLDDDRFVLCAITALGSGTAIFTVIMLSFLASNNWLRLMSLLLLIAHLIAMRIIQSGRLTNSDTFSGVIAFGHTIPGIMLIIAYFLWMFRK